MRVRIVCSGEFAAVSDAMILAVKIDDEVEISVRSKYCGRVD